MTKDLATFAIDRQGAQGKSGNDVLEVHLDYLIDGESEGWYTDDG